MNPTLIKFAGYQPPGSINTQAARRFGDALERRLAERVSFELIGSVLDQGRPSADLVPMVERGELSLCYMSAVRFVQAAPQLAFFDLPFVVADRTAVYRALDGEFGDRQKTRVAASGGCRVLGFWDNGFRHLTNSVRPIRSPDDCKGLRIRTQSSPLHGEVFRALGFEPIAADIKEFTEQIATQRFQAQDNSLANMHVFGVHKHHRYLTLSGHFFGVSLLICNDAHYRAWPQDVRFAVDEAAFEATAHQRQLAQDEDEAVLSRLDSAENEVVRLTDAERAAFVAAVAPVLTRHRERLGPVPFE